jgi:hypothetical protein
MADILVTRHFYFGAFCGVKYPVRTIDLFLITTIILPVLLNRGRFMRRHQAEHDAALAGGR